MEKNKVLMIGSFLCKLHVPLVFSLSLPSSDSYVHM